MASVPNSADTVARRRDVLAELSTPRTKPELVDRLDASRSTVDRAVDALISQGFVERRDSEYVATYAGTAAASAYEQFLQRLESLAAVQPVLGVLAPDIDIPPAVFDGATVRESAPEAPEVPVEDSIELVVGSSVFRGTAPAILSRYLDVFLELVDSGTELELVLTAAVAEQLETTYPDSLATLEDEADISLYVTEQSLPYAVWSAERPEGTVSGLIAYGENGLAGIISNDTPAMNEWATEQYEQFKRGARPLD